MPRDVGEVDDVAEDAGAREQGLGELGVLGVLGLVQLDAEAADRARHRIERRVVAVVGAVGRDEVAADGHLVLPGAHPELASGHEVATALRRLQAWDDAQRLLGDRADVSRLADVQVVVGAVAVTATSAIVSP